jgi:general secretion pathway protein G
MQKTIQRLRSRRDELKDGQGGFTLIELLIVIVILAILAAIVVFAVQNLSGTSAQASCNSDYKTVQTAIEAYKAQMGSYPKGGGTAGNVSSVTATDSGTVGVIGTGINAAANAGVLMTKSDTPLNLNSPSGTQVGEWLKNAPVNGNHYGIVVSNDGLGTIQVDTVTAGVATATPVGTGANAGTCAAVS